MANKTVMVVEDDNFLSDAYRVKFENSGYEVSHAADGESAFKMIKQNPPDVIILDLLLPKMDGFEVLQKIKATDELSKIPVLIATNYPEKENLARAKEFGADDLFIKSEIAISDLIDRCNELLG